MPDHTDNGLRAAIKALSDVVGPAVDPANPLAVEQLKLVIQFLEFFTQRRGTLLAFEQAELRWHADMASSLTAMVEDFDPSLAAELAESVQVARSPDLAINRDALLAETSRLATLISNAVRAVGLLDRPGARQVEREVIEKAGEFLDLKRAWFLPFGFEPTPEKVPSLPSLLKDQSGSELPPLQV